MMGSENDQYVTIQDVQRDSFQCQVWHILIAQKTLTYYSPNQWNPRQAFLTQQTILDGFKSLIM